MPSKYYKGTRDLTKSSVDQVTGVGNCFIMAPKAAVELVGGAHNSIATAVVRMGGTCKGALESAGYSYFAPEQGDWVSALREAVDKDLPACLLVTWWQIDEMEADAATLTPATTTIIKKGSKLSLTPKRKSTLAPTAVADWERNSIDNFDADGLAGKAMDLKVTGAKGTSFTVKAKVEASGKALKLAVSKVLNPSLNEVSIDTSKDTYRWDLGSWKRYGKHVVYVIGYEDDTVYARDQQNAHALMAVTGGGCPDFTVGHIRRGCRLDAVNIGVKK